VSGTPSEPGGPLAADCPLPFGLPAGAGCGGSGAAVDVAAGEVGQQPSALQAAAYTLPLELRIQVAEVDRHQVVGHAVQRVAVACIASAVAAQQRLVVAGDQATALLGTVGIDCDQAVRLEVALEERSHAGRIEGVRLWHGVGCATGFEPGRCRTVGDQCPAALAQRRPCFVHAVRLPSGQRLPRHRLMPDRREWGGLLRRRQGCRWRCGRRRAVERRRLYRGLWRRGRRGRRRRATTEQQEKASQQAGAAAVSHCFREP